MRFTTVSTRRERHLDVDLRELGLAVGAQVFVAEAARDLEVLVEAGNHQDLLEDLRRLRQRVESAVMDARRHQVVARAFGRGASEQRRLDLEEALLVEVAAYLERDLVAQQDVALHASAGAGRGSGT